MATVPCSAPPALSGERFQVHYRFAGSEAEALARAEDVCLEQTVEFPAELLPAGPIREAIVGRIESFAPADGDDGGGWLGAVSYPVEAAGGELCQLLNVILGNSSLKPGVRVERFELSESLTRRFRGPRFGRQGLRQLLDVQHRPLLSTALKPMGLPAADLADLAYRFALGGIDLIKDDHGLADQPFSPFEERVSRCAEAVDRANRQTHGRCLYAPNVTGGADDLPRRAAFARQAGAGALLISPGLCGFDAMRAVADDASIALPILSHPAFQGGWVASPECGFSHFALFGQLARLAGADASIFPNFGGRFFFSRAQCQEIAAGTAAPMGAIRPIFPAPAGGMSLDRVEEMGAIYGREMILLVGGGLFRHGPDLVENCRYFRMLAEAIGG